MKDKQDDREFFENVVGITMGFMFVTIVILGLVGMFRALI
jgi:hypothetical protein